MAKKKKEVKIHFIGNNAEDVTGSCTIIEFGDRKIAFECGGVQEGKTTYDNYKLNKKMLQKIKAKDIDMVILGHSHYDHIGNVPTIFKQNNDVRIITNEKTSCILQEMWLDSAFVNQRDIDLLKKQYPDKYFEVFYDDGDVFQTISNVEEYSPNTIHKLDDQVSIRFSYSGHIFGAVQTELFITLDNKVKKIVFTSDLGNIKTSHLKPFVQEFEPITSANLVIAETTYGARQKEEVTKKIVEKDLEKIKSVITEFCKEKRKRVLFPVFSLDKCPNVLWLIYSMFKDDEDFTTKVLVDSPLTNRLLDRYSEVLDGEAKEKFDEMLAWKNLIRIIEADDSKRAIETFKNVVVLSSGGMLQSGRSVRWAMDMLPHSDDCILFSGYCGENTLGFKIKNGNEQKTININGKPCKNKCQIVALKSMSSHMQRTDMINYYKSFNAEKICLVHGEINGKIEFAEDLRKELANCSKTTKVCVVNNGTTITL